MCMHVLLWVLCTCHVGMHAHVCLCVHVCKLTG